MTAQTKTFMLILALFMSYVSASAQILPTNSVYLGVVPHRTNATVTFELHLVNWPNRPLGIQLLGFVWDGLGGKAVIALSASATNKSNGIIDAKFPFRGRYRGRFDPERNVIVGRLYGFTRDRRHAISQRRFELDVYDPAPTDSTFPGPGSLPSGMTLWSHSDVTTGLDWVQTIPHNTTTNRPRLPLWPEWPD